MEGRLSPRPTEEVEVMAAVMLDMEDAVPPAEVDTADAVVTAAEAEEAIEVCDSDCSRSEFYFILISLDLSLNVLIRFRRRRRISRR